MIKIWRETNIELADIQFKNIKILEILGYPYAGNDVFECICDYKGEKVISFVKVERNELSYIKNEINILGKLSYYFNYIPEILDSGTVNDKYYICTKKIEGEKLSNLLKGEKNSFESMKYMYNYGTTLANIHSLKIEAEKAKQRKINNIPEKIENDSFFDKAITWLEKNKFDIKFDTFIHGDFHYANVFWDKYLISGVIDWEYSGIGFKEQDIAWSIILRPSQKFMKTKKEIKLFLKGYRSIGNYDDNKLKWCLVNGYAHFYRMEKNKNSKYAQILKKHICSIIDA